MLDREFGVPPLEETTALHQAVIAGAVPSAVSRPQPSAPSPRHRPLTGRRTRRPLLGRDTELGMLGGRTPRSGVTAIVVEGESGIGKIRLAEELLSRAWAAGATAFVAETLRAALTAAPADWRNVVPARLLVKAARLAPTLSAMSVLLAACTGPPTGPRSTCSLDLLTWLVRRLEGRPVCLVATWRSEEPRQTVIVTSPHYVRYGGVAWRLGTERDGKIERDGSGAAGRDNACSSIWEWDRSRPRPSCTRSLSPGSSPSPTATTSPSWR
ncbi:MAG: hypothetical protein ACRDYX_04205 [Egibacteraceae bacterium]